MKRALPIALALSALALIAPGQALAQHHHHHHHAKAKRRAHHAKAHFVHFAPPSGSAVPTAAPTPPPPAPATSTPTAPTENAGTVTTFTGGVLTLTLNDKSTAIGKVTSNTQIVCVSATPPSNHEGDDNGQGDDNHGGSFNGGRFGNQGDWMNGGDQGGNQGDQGGDQGESCGESALVANTPVRFAELRIGPSGTEFETVVLVTESKTTPGGGDFDNDGD